MRIGINLIQYKDIQGIEIFIKNILDNLNITPDDEVILFTNQKSAEIFKPHQPQIKIVKRNFFPLNKLNLIFYQQFLLVRKLKQEKIDLLFCPSLAGPIFYRKKIVTIHDLAFLIFPQESNLFGRLYLRFSLLSAKYFSYKIITVSEFSKQEIIRLLHIKKEKIAVISAAVPKLAKLDPATSEKVLEKFKLKDKKYFIYIGNIRYRKNLPNTIQAFKLFLNSQADYQFIIAGKKDRRLLDLENYVKINSLQKNISFLGFISSIEKVALIKNAQALVFTSAYEGFGLPVLEAQALQTAVITSTTSSLPEIAGRGAILVNPNDINSIYTGLQEITDNIEKRKKIIHEGEANIKKYSWPRTSQKLMNIIKSYENTRDK